MKKLKREAAELEAELLRLNTLVRARRQQLARLENCPHKDCECRRVWREVVEENLTRQVGKIRQRVRNRRQPQPTPKRARRLPAPR